MADERDRDDPENIGRSIEDDTVGGADDEFEDDDLEDDEEDSDDTVEGVE
jgi:hypothetical protein